MDLKSNMDKGLKYLSSVGASYDEYALQVQEMNGGISERVGLSLSPDQAQKMSKRFEYAGAFASGNKLASDAGSMMQQSWATVEKSLKPYLAHFDNARDKEQFLNDAKSNFDSARAKAKKQVSTARGKKLDDTFNEMGRRLNTVFDDTGISPTQKTAALQGFRESVDGLIKDFPAKASALSAKRDQFIMATVFPPLQEMLAKQNDPVAIATMGDYIDGAFANSELSDRFSKYRDKIETPSLSAIYSNGNGTKAAIYARYYTDVIPKGNHEADKRKRETMEGLKRYIGPEYPSNLAYAIYGLKKEARSDLGKLKELKPFVTLKDIDPKFFSRLSFFDLNKEGNQDAKNKFLEDIQDPEKLLEKISDITIEHGNSHKPAKL